VLIDDSLANAFVLEKVRGSRHTTRKEQQVGISEIALLEHHVSLDVHTMSRLNQGEVCNAYSSHVNTTTTQNVDGNQSFNILEAIC
jgi:hypothetical protein